jgi:hypothetical protein
MDGSGFYTTAIVIAPWCNCYDVKRIIHLWAVGSQWLVKNTVGQASSGARRVPSPRITAAHYYLASA